MSFKFRQLEAFRAVVSAGSVQEAATQLFITQPAVSRLIKDLEHELGFMLFDRAKGRLVLTEQGSLFFESMETHFLGIERLSNTAKTIRQNIVQKITLACSPTISSTLLPECIAAIQKTYSQLHIDIHTTELANIRSMMQRGVADMAMCLDFPVTSGVSRRRLGSVDALCAMPDGHRLTQQEQVKLEDLKGESIIEWLPISPFVHSDEHALLERHHITNTCLLRTQTAHTRYALIAAGLGISITEPFTAKNWLGLGVSTRPITPTVQFDYIVAYQKNLESSELIQSSLSIIQTIYEQYTAKM